MTTAVVRASLAQDDVDGRVKPGHDESRRFSDLNFKQQRGLDSRRVRASTFPRRDASEWCKNCSPQNRERAQGMPDARCTRSLMCENKKAHEVVTTGHRSNPAFPAQWF